MDSIETELIAAHDAGWLQRAVAVLRSGGLVAFPTDTVYGLGALVGDAEAVELIYRAKDRPIEKAIPILLGEAGDMTAVSSEIPAAAHRLAARFWPGPLTLVIPKHPSLPDSVSATATVGVRVPDHAIARELLRAAGPMAVTSANISGAPSPSTAAEVLDQLGGRITLIIDGGITPGGVPSTVVDCTGSGLRIIRPGPLSLEELQLTM